MAPGAAGRFSLHHAAALSICRLCARLDAYKQRQAQPYLLRQSSSVSARRLLHDQPHRALLNGLKGRRETHDTLGLFAKTVTTVPSGRTMPSHDFPR